MEVESKTSDEILEELFSALNVPLSPKAKIDTPPENADNSVESEGSEDKEADSKSSDTDEEPKEQEQEEKVAKNHKHKTSKKKKEKKKKKKKHKKKDDDNRHKSKKKHKKASVVESGEDNNSIPVVVIPDAAVKAEEVTGKVPAVVSELPEISIISNSQEVEDDDEVTILTKPKSPKSEGETCKTVTLVSKGKNDVNSDAGIKEELAKKLAKKLKSPQRSHSSSKSLHSRSRSTSRVRHRQSRSRSRHGRHSRSRSRSKSKHGSRHSRSRSRTKSSSVFKSRAKSPHELDKLKRKRKSSRSRSRSLSPRSSKRRRFSRSPSSKNARRRSFSKSISPKFSRRKRYPRSRSPTPTKTSSKYRSRSRSGSRTKRMSQLKEISNAFCKAFESSSSRLDTLKDQKPIEIDLSSIPTPDVQHPSNLPISLESIPLPIPPVSSGVVPDPSSIPLPQPVIHGKELQNGKEHVEAKINNIDIGTIPVPGSAVESPVKEQEPTKPADTGTEKSKAKMIIIKSLKDSLIYMQAQEEAERRAKEKEDDEPEPTEEENGDDKAEDDDDDDDDDEEAEEEVEEGEEEDKEEKEKEKDVVDDDDDGEGLIQELEKVVETEENGNQEPEKIEVKAVKKIKELEEGEIVSETEINSKTKSHKKKSKKDKDKSKDKKKSKKEKSKEKKKQVKEKEKSGSKERSAKSRSRSKERSKHKKSSSGHRDHDPDRRKRRYSRSRSRSRDRHSRFRHRSYSRSRSRSRSRSGRKRDCVTDLRDKVTRKRLLEIARRNAVYLMQNGCLPPSVEQEQLVKIKTGGKSVEELTDFCKQLVATGNYSDAELSDPSLSSDDDNDNPDKPFSYTRHPFSVRDSKPILMNIRNAPMLPTKTNAERLADHAKLREQFPVSSGSQHRNKGEVNTTEEKLRTADSGWVPVSPKEKKPKEEDSVFSKEKTPAVDISQIVSSRLSAMRKLQDNPHDMEALKTLHNVQKEMQSWALSKQEPGQFTGSTGVKILSQEELCAGQQAWVRKVSTCQVLHADVAGKYLSHEDAAPHRRKIPESLGHYQGPD